VAATGAALVLGALPRIWDRRRPRDAILFGVGAAVLATSRPVEGFIFCVPLGVALLCWILRQESSMRRISIRRVIVPLAAMLCCIVGFVAFYNWRVAGSPVVFPHFIEQRRYITTAIFLWQRDKPPISYANPQFEDFYHNFLPSLYQASWAAAEGQLEWKSTAFWQFFLGPALVIPFFALPWVLKNPRNRLLLVQVVLSALGLWIVVYYNPHYAAPIMVTIVVLMMQGMRILREWRIRGHAIGVGWTRLIVLFSLLIGPAHLVRLSLSGRNPNVALLHHHNLLVLAATAAALALWRLGSQRALQLSSRHARMISCCELLLLAAVMLQIAVLQRNLYPDDYPFVDDLAEPFRKPVEQKLDALPGEHLVLVRYAKDHNSGEEYVYNEADIDHAKIVWAREIPGMDLGPLLNYFRNRDVWVFEPDEDDESVTPYLPRQSAQ